MIALLDGKSIIVTTVLLTSTGSLGSQPATRLCSARRPNCPRWCGSQRILPCEECCAEVEEECGQALYIARETWTVPMEVTILRNDTKQCEVRSLSHTRENVCVCNTCAVRCTVYKKFKSIIERKKETGNSKLEENGSTTKKREENFTSLPLLGVYPRSCWGCLVSSSFW